jgi:hypothetical protein
MALTFDEPKEGMSALLGFGGRMVMDRLDQIEFVASLIIDAAAIQISGHQWVVKHIECREQYLRLGNEAEHTP